MLRRPRAGQEFSRRGCRSGTDFTCNRVMALIAPGRTSPRLSPRQRRLLELLCDGHQYKTAAAAAMGVTVNTVGFHVRRMYVRLGVHSKSEAVAKAFREDLLRWHTT